MSYIDAKNLQDIGEATNADELSVFKLLADSASRIFDLACEVPENFFNKAITGDKTFFGDNTKFLRISPYLAESITEVLIDETEISEDEYFEKDGFLIFNREISSRTKVKVSADFGFKAIPSDVKGSCIELGLLMWRRKDLNFAQISDVDNAAIYQQLPPTTALVVKKYREKYSQFSKFG